MLITEMIKIQISFILYEGRNHNNIKRNPMIDGVIKLIFTPSSTLWEKGSKNGVINGASNRGNAKIETNDNVIRINFIYKFE